MQAIGDCCSYRAMSKVILIHHAARRGRRHPPSSLSGLRDCLAAGAQCIEVDLTPLADGDFALLHDARLEAATNGVGPVAAATAEQVQALRHRRRGRLTDEPVGLLSQVVEIIAGYADPPASRQPVELQLDLKPHVALTDAVLANLACLVAPVRGQVRVSSVDDRALRRLAALDPALPLGFDPMRYLDVDLARKPGAVESPACVGDYGYRDDHPLAADQWGRPADYLALRADGLWKQMPAAVWYVRGLLLARMLADGFDWIAFLHSRGAQAAAWTLDPDQPHQLHLARLLVAAGVDRITTNDAPAMAVALA